MRWRLIIDPRQRTESDQSADRCIDRGKAGADANGFADSLLGRDVQNDQFMIVRGKSDLGQGQIEIDRRLLHVVDIADLGVDRQ